MYNKLINIYTAKVFPEQELEHNNLRTRSNLNFPLCLKRAKKKQKTKENLPLKQ